MALVPTLLNERSIFLKYLDLPLAVYPPTCKTAATETHHRLNLRNKKYFVGSLLVNIALSLGKIRVMGS